MSRYLYKKIQNISPESLNFQHSGLKLTTLGSDPIKNGNLFESRKGFFFWTGYAYSPKSVVDAMLKELIYTQERIL